MRTGKALKLGRKSVHLQKEVLEELDSLTRSVARAEKLILDLKEEMEAVGAKHQNRTTTRDDIAYLEDLLRCAKKKLAWENLMEGLGKRTPSLLQKVSAIMSDEQNPPTDEVRAGIMQALQSIQSAMERLDQAKVQ